MDYTKIYEILRGSDLAQFQSLSLPIDANGIDIFKSKDKVWKLQNGFAYHFDTLIAVIDYCIEAKENPALSGVFYDFRGFIFPIHLEFKGRTFTKTVDFGQAIFEERFKIQECHFQQGLYAASAVFQKDCVIEKRIRLGGLYFKGCHFKDFVTIDDNVEIQDFALFDHAIFSKCISVSRIKLDCQTQFSHCTFKGAEEGYENRFEEFEASDIDFNEAQFAGSVIFENVRFKGNSNFLNTHFSPIAETTFIDCFVENQLSFKSTDKNQKIFRHEVFMQFEEEAITGRILFENVNFEHIPRKQREALTRLSKFDKVHIGKGCLKYRFVSAIRVVLASMNNQNLITDFAKAFASFFTHKKGVNLGIEIVYQDTQRTEFFYFTDDDSKDLTKAKFERYLSDTEMDILGSFFQNQTSNTEGEMSVVSKAEDFLNRFEVMMTVNNFFERIRLKIARNEWTENDTAQFLNALSFGTNEREQAVLPEGVTEEVLVSQNELGIPPRFLHHLIETNYQLETIFHTHAQRLQTQDFTKLIAEPQSFKEKIQLSLMKGDIDIVLLDLKNYFELDTENSNTVILWASQFNNLKEWAKSGVPQVDIRQEYQRICANIMRFSASL